MGVRVGCGGAVCSAAIDDSEYACTSNADGEKFPYFPPPFVHVGAAEYGKDVCPEGVRVKQRSYI